ncbi:ubiquinol--cytochrome-c reductase catalytic subunit rip1 [Entomophthora muscae]|uniref:Ubiquinol--cytochrome-c reductase catalytic subunit rip1 n=1 Tax=Entomophthora muscae TaxID=34485 RepID=A0ACC2TH40_9FUNG|nr:ubiquinol--cytochrome-c reductase catalytic subunit rip1 [Entomophthora muscae]
MSAKPLASRLSSSLVNATRFTSPAIGAECFKSATYVLPRKGKACLPSREWSSKQTSSPSLGLFSKTSFTAPGAIIAQQRFFSTGSLALESTKIPDFSAYRKLSGDFTNRTFTYFMVGTTGVLTAASAKITVQDFSC